MALVLVPKCPKCDRLSIDNVRHCDKLTPSRWAVVCKWVKCLNCKYTYGQKNFLGFWPDGKPTKGFE